jgi:hypothetical protein
VHDWLPTIRISDPDGHRHHRRTGSGLVAQDTAW